MNRMRMMFAALAAAFCFAAQAGAQAPPTPGPEHKFLAEGAGTWDCTIKMADVAEESKGTSVSKMELGGMWLVTDFSGDMGGMKYTGKGLDGYDTQKKKFVGVWADSSGTAPMLMEGDYDKETKTLTMTGEGPDMTGAMAKYKLVTKYTDKDHHVFTMFTVGDDEKETQVFTIEYVRKK